MDANDPISETTLKKVFTKSKNIIYRFIDMLTSKETVQKHFTVNFFKNCPHSCVPSLLLIWNLLLTLNLLLNLTFHRYFSDEEKNVWMRNHKSNQINTLNIESDLKNNLTI
jgi:hypothetical protein